MSRPGKVETTRADRAQAFEGLLGELVREVSGPGGLTVWMLGWRCKKCGHCWPIRQLHLKAACADGSSPTQLPKRCPGCDSPNWTRPYITKTHNGKPHAPRGIKGRTLYGKAGKAIVHPRLEEDAGLGLQPAGGAAETLVLLEPKA